MSKGRKIFHWMLTILFLFMTLGCFISHNAAGGIINLVLTIIALPFGLMAQTKGKKRVLKWIVSFVLLIVCMATFPQNNTAKGQKTSQAKAIVESTASINDSVTPTVTEAVSETPTPTETPAVTSAPAQTPALTPAPVSLQNIPAFSGNPYVAINNNEPYFSDGDLTTTAFENYSDLDSLGRCGVAYANVCKDIMPTEKRGAIGNVKPTGWHTIKYDNVDGKYLYNRCHLIGYQLSAENANPKNLITGTRYLNVTGMLPFENMVADYVKETNHHVLYRVTPIFDGDNLLASGVLMEAESVEDKGEGIKFCVYCYNVQPGITINYANGDSSADNTAPTATAKPTQQAAPKPTAAPSAAKAAPAAMTPVVTQAPQATPAPTAAPAGSNTMVWLSETGNSYHSRKDCGRMNPDKAYQVTEAEAIAEGKTKCSKCW